MIVLTVLSNVTSLVICNSKYNLCRCIAYYTATNQYQQSLPDSGIELLMWLMEYGGFPNMLNNLLDKDQINN